MKKGINKYTGIIILAAFLLSACDQKPASEKINCAKAVSKMTADEKEECKKSASETFRGGSYTPSSNKEW